MKSEFFQLRKSYMRFLLLKILVILGLVAIDYFVKSIFFNNFVEGQTMDLIPGWLGFLYAKNTGGAFSIFNNRTEALALVSLIMIILFFVFDYFYYEKSTLYNIAFMFILGGAIGNFIDRILYGFVVDFIQIKFAGIAFFPIFNLADMFLTTGIIIYIIYVLFYHNSKYETKPAKVVSSVNEDSFIEVDKNTSGLTGKNLGVMSIDDVFEVPESDKSELLKISELTENTITVRNVNDQIVIKDATNKKNDTENKSEQIIVDKKQKSREILFGKQEDK